MRVGHLAKGLLLKGDRQVELAVLCSEKPTVTMLDRVMDALPKQLEVQSFKGHFFGLVWSVWLTSCFELGQILAAEEKYEIRKNVPDCGILIISSVEPKIEVKITLTSPLMRAAVEAPGGKNIVYLGYEVQVELSLVGWFIVGWSLKNQRCICDAEFFLKAIFTVIILKLSVKFKSYFLDYILTTSMTLRLVETTSKLIVGTIFPVFVSTEK